VLAVEILVQAVVVVLAVLQDKRCRPELAGGVAAPDEIGMLGRVTHVDAHDFVPPVRYRRETWIDGRPQRIDQIWQRIVEVFVFTAPKTVPRHHDAAAI